MIPRRLHDKVALVTGAASGIGLATAIRLASEGARIAAVDQNESGLEDTVLGINHLRISEAIPVVTDVSDSAQVQESIKRVIAKFGRLDIVFNAVGVGGQEWGDAPLHEITEEAWNRVLSINLTSMFLMCKYTIPHLLRAGSGSIINLSSVLGMVGDTDFATHAYATSQAGIIGMSRAMAVYYAPQRIRVNVIAPALIATQMTELAQSDKRIQSRLKQLQPLTGTFGQPEDVAAAVAYLASDDAKFVTGTVLTVDGGWTAQ